MSTVEKILKLSNNIIEIEEVKEGRDLLGNSGYVCEYVNSKFSHTDYAGCLNVFRPSLNKLYKQMIKITEHYK